MAVSITGIGLKGIDLTGPKGPNDFMGPSYD